MQEYAPNVKLMTLSNYVAFSRRHSYAMNNLGLVGVIMIFYKNSLFLILLLSALYLSGCEKTQNNGSILYYEQNKFEVDIKQLIDNRYYIIFFVIFL